MINCSNFKLCTLDSTKAQNKQYKMGYGPKSPTNLFNRMTSTTDSSSRAKDDSLDILRAEVEELKRQRYSKAGPGIPLRLPTTENGRELTSTRKENEKSHHSGARKKTLPVKEKLIKHNTKISRTVEEEFLQDLKSSENLCIGTKKEKLPLEDLSRDPIDLAQMELMEFEDEIGIENEELGAVLEKKTEKDQDEANTSNTGDKRQGGAPPRLLSINKLLSMQSTDSDQDSGSLKISVEFSELHQRVADLLTKNESLERQNVSYKRKVRSLQLERLEILKINYMWEEQHVKLNKEHEQALKDQEKVIQKLHRQLSEETKSASHSVLEEKDAEIVALKQELKQTQEKIAVIQSDIAEAKAVKQKLAYLASNAEHMHAMLEEEKKEKELIIQRETHSQQQIKAMESIIGVTEAQLNRSNARRKLLEDEVKRLATVISEHSDDIDKMAPTQRNPNYRDNRSANFSRELSNEQREQVELLKHQIVTYKEDFKCEREEKEKFMEENKRLKTELRSYRDKIVTLQRQAAVYENSFRNEREERIRLMRLTGQLPPDTRRWEVTIPPPRLNYTPYFDQREVGGWGITARSSANPQSKELEYAKLAEEKEQIVRRMHELEIYNVDRKQELGQEQGPRSPGGPRRNRNESNRSEDLVPDSFEAIHLSSDRQEPLSPKVPNACPRCGLSPQSKKEFVSHFEKCDRS